LTTDKRTQCPGGGDIDDKKVDTVSPITINNNQLTLMSDSNESDPFDEIWKNKPKRPNQSKAKTKKAYNARIKEGVTHADLLAGLLRYTAHVEAQGTEPRFQKQLSTFLNADEHWKQPYEIAGKVPDNIKDIRRLVREKNLTVPSGGNLKAARKAIAAATGMAL